MPVGQDTGEGQLQGADPSSMSNLFLVGLWYQSPSEFLQLLAVLLCSHVTWKQGLTPSSCSPVSVLYWKSWVVVQCVRCQHCAQSTTVSPTNDSDSGLGRAAVKHPLRCTGKREVRGDGIIF